MSGLTYRKNIIESGNKVIPEQNLYPWMSYQIISLSIGDIYFLHGNHARITSDTPKLFSYGDDGLFPEICEAIFAGFNNNYRSAVYYSIRVLGGIGSWRIFRAARIKAVCFLKFLMMIFDRRMSNFVLLAITPIIFWETLKSQASQIKRVLARFA